MLTFKFEYSDNTVQEKQFNTQKEASDFANLEGDRLVWYGVKITVKDIIEYLQEHYSLDADVCLDKDGWMDLDLDYTTAKELIHQRGIFDKFENCCFINN